MRRKEAEGTRHRQVRVLRWPAICRTSNDMVDMAASWHITSKGAFAHEMPLVPLSSLLNE